MSNIHVFVFKGLLCLDELQKFESTGLYIRESDRRLGRNLSDLSFAEFSQTIRDGAEKMSRLYMAFFCFENSARELIVQIMRDKHGDNWWETCVPVQIKNKVKTRKEQEQKNKWHQARSRNDIDYADFGDMPGIIINNWVDFEALFDTQEWVKGRFGDLEKSRNVIAHNNVLESQEIDRIRLYLQDWARIIGL